MFKVFGFLTKKQDIETQAFIDDNILADHDTADPIGSQKDGSGLELSVDRVQGPG
jgi:hypothetical protein